MSGVSAPAPEKCQEKACPFFAEPGAVLCSFHCKVFTYGVSLEDRGSPISDHLENGTVVGFKLPTKPRARSTAEKTVDRVAARLDLMTQMLASGLLLKASVGVLEAANTGERETLFANPFIAHAGSLEGTAVPGRNFLPGMWLSRLAAAVHQRSRPMDVPAARKGAQDHIANDVQSSPSGSVRLAEGNLDAS
jgi:hypothetical protein